MKWCAFSMSVVYVVLAAINLIGMVAWLVIGVTMVGSYRALALAFSFVAACAAIQFILRMTR